ncbi:hypothetical protein ACROYT_G003688 [Oculina patagonica]
MGRRATLSVLFLILTAVNLTSVEDVYERHEGRCDWVCEIADLNFGEELKNLKGQGTIVKAEVQYRRHRVTKPKVNNSTDIFTEVWMTLWTDDAKPGLQSHGSVQLVNKTLMQISLSGQFISWRYRKLTIFCIKPSTNLLQNYSRGLDESACAGHQRPILSLHARDSSNYRNLISFFGYIWTDKTSRFFVGFVIKPRNENDSYDFAFYLVCIVFIYFNPAMLALFCTTDITVQAHKGLTEKDRCQPKTKSSQIEVPLFEGDETTKDDNENIDDEKDKQLIGTNREEDRITVRLINVRGLKPKGFRSLIADNVFPNTGNRSELRNTVLRRKVFNLRNALNDRSAEHDVAGITASICTTRKPWEHIK